MAILKNTTVNTALILPTGTTAERPAVPQAGMIRHNSTSNSFEYYNGTIWVVYHSGVAASGGNNTYDFGPFRVHAFTGSGSFIVSSGGTVDVLIVAGGGGGASHVPGGGGAGGLIYRPGLAVTAQTYAITVGGAGAGSYNPGSYGGMPNSSQGGDSTGFGLTAKGGGHGVGWFEDGTRATIAGGSGGGANINRGAGGAATQPSQSGDSGLYGFGNAGATSFLAGSDPYPCGGGGGAGGPGMVGPTIQRAGDGGPGRYYGDKFGTIYGEDGWFAGGGAGGSWGFTSNGRGYGGIGGGGDGDTTTGNGSGPSVRFSINEPTGESGGINTGGGGGGAGRTGGESSRGGAGGSGIIMIRYLR
jgi:hypothetical protein